MRQGELLGLRWSDVDWDNGRLFVHTSLSYVREQPEDKLHFVLGRTKTKRSDRKVRLIARAMEALRTHQARQIEERQRLV
jgi:integrase